MKYTPLVLLLIPTLAVAQKPKATTEDYKKFTKQCAVSFHNLNNPKYWENIELVRKDDKTKVKFKDLTDLEKKTFYFITAEKLTSDMHKVYNLWSNNLEVAKEKAKTGAEDENPTVKELEEFLSQLLTVRKLTAVKFEAIVEDLFKSDGNFTEEEKKKYIGQIKAWHDKEQLIERK